MGKMVFKNICYLFNTARGYSVLFIIMLLITLITPAIWLYSHLFDKQRSLLLLLIRFFIRLFFYLNGIFLKKAIDLKGLKPPQKNEKRIYIINHSSLLDGLLLFLLPGHNKFMAKKFWARIPIFGLGVTEAGNISVSDDSDGNALDMYMQASEILEQNYPLIIFPEGTRNREGGIGRFQNSAFMLALEKKTDIVIIVTDAWNTMRPSSILIRETDLRMEMVDIIYYNQFKHMDYKELSNCCKKKMIQGLLQIRDRKRRENKNYYRHQAEFVGIDNTMRAEMQKLCLNDG